MIQFIVPAVPVPQPRARATAFNGRARMYEAKKSHPIHDFKAMVRLIATQAHRGPPIEGPIRLFATFVLPRPKSAPKKQRERIAHTKRGDVDNFLKAVMDALNKLLWNDDAQIYLAQCRKYVADVDELPHVEIKVLPGVHPMDGAE